MNTQLPGLSGGISLVTVSCPGGRVSHSRVWSAEVRWGESWQAGGRHSRVWQVVPGHGLNCCVAASPRGLHPKTSSPEDADHRGFQQRRTAGRVSAGRSFHSTRALGAITLLRAPWHLGRERCPSVWWAHRGDPRRLPKRIGTWPAGDSRRSRVPVILPVASTEIEPKNVPPPTPAPPRPGL